MTTSERHREPSICRVCSNTCGVLVETEHGEVVRVIGDRENPLYRGYSCEKGRNHARLYNHPQRILKPLKRMPSGHFVEISLSDALDEISERIGSIAEAHGPRSLALYWGSYFVLESSVNMPVFEGFCKAFGTPMVFNPVSIDQPGKSTAKGMHGMWMAPVRDHDAEVVLFVGHNPLVSHQNRTGNPHQVFTEIADRGAKLIVVDPRRTETAAKAHLHLQLRPGTDAVLLAGMLRQIFAEGLEDTEFLAENVDGVQELRKAVEAFEPDFVAQRTGVSHVDMIAAARLFASSRAGYALGGVGFNMSGEGTLNEYLLLCLDTVCGHWSREGDPINAPLTLYPPELMPGKAQAMPPFPSFDLGERMRSRPLGQTHSGMPSAALADEILMDDDGRIRAMISMGGNPINSIPDQPRMRRAIEALDLLVHVDIQMSPTAKLADYIIPSKLGYEQAAASTGMEFLQMYGNGLGPRTSYAQYTPPIVDPPAGSEVIEQWELLWGVAERLGLQLTIQPGFGDLIKAGEPFALDMSQKPDTESLLSRMFPQPRIPLEEIKKHRHGALFPVEGLKVQPKDPGWEGRLQLGDPLMLEEINGVLGRESDVDSEGYPFRLICRRSPHVMNTPPPAVGQPSYNPAFMDQADLDRLGLVDGDVVEISSSYGTILAVAESDVSLQEGVVSMSHSWGDLPDHDKDVRAIGSNSGRLVSNHLFFDRFTGQPRMTNIPVNVVPCTSDVPAAAPS